jgi:hypothetical protein
VEAWLVGGSSCEVGTCIIESIIPCVCLPREIYNIVSITCVVMMSTAATEADTLGLAGDFNHDIRK